MSFDKLLTVIKAWPTHEELLRKGLLKNEQATDTASVKLRSKARLLKLRAAQRKRRRELEDKQRERSAVPEVK